MASHRHRDHGSKRLDIQGLRMVAVVAVVANHLTDWPSGGFVGVDVFFVISGYLITGLLIRDLGRSGVGLHRFIADFYRRRIRRLFPAALVTIVVTIVFAHIALTGSRADDVGVDGWWAAVFLANWHFAEVGTDYFAGAGESPLQHYWSLSVEEQFYVVWPLALFAVAAVAGARTSLQRRRVVVLAASTLLVGASLWVAFGQSADDPTGAYFSTVTRGWELGLGALMACVVPYMRGNAVVLTAMSWTGMVAIGVSLFVITDTTTFPAPGALLPCLGAALVIAAVSPDARAWNVVLTSRPAVFVGDISYSVYLVHFPVIVLLAPSLGDAGWYYNIACVLLILGLSMALYGFIERPVLESNWLAPKKSPEQARAADSTADGFFSTPVHVLAATTTVVALGLSAMALWPGNQDEIRDRYQVINRTLDEPVAQELPPQAARLQREIGAALAATRWPDLQPSMEQELEANGESALISRCGQIEMAPTDECLAGDPDARRTIVVAGDSTSMVYGEAFESIVQDDLDGWRMRFAGTYGCAFSPVVYDNADSRLEAGCAEHTADVVAEVKKLRPELLIVTNQAVTLPRASDGEPQSPRDQALALRPILEDLTGYVDHVALLLPPPGGHEPVTCYRPGGNPAACATTVPDDWADSRAALTFVAEEGTGASAIDSQPWFCSEADFCPAFVGDMVTMRDRVHATTTYVHHIEPALLEGLRRSGALPSR
ncbi:acyltransferase family protein [Nocardioides sp. Arc9.136]|uniref:acyltransferase family protein n=1 Tax=Nocardioides sp. Arc9.136 TaxID=2996826 RepID=UPI0026655BB0|nr:acyltransferase family protein [Nocardioides sp. Arc9.136]WKN47158.1 acyltransferase family protein [Nocardioides sp. Arc9.136]